MTREYLSIGPTPYGEHCVQVTEDGADYWADMQAECKRFKTMLEKRFPFYLELDDYGGPTFTIKSSRHDFGSYAEVCVGYGDNNPTAFDFAVFVEHHTPEWWTDEAVFTLEDMQEWKKKQQEENEW